MVWQCERSYEDNPTEDANYALIRHVRLGKLRINRSSKHFHRDRSDGKAESRDRIHLRNLTRYSLIWVHWNFPKGQRFHLLYILASFGASPYPTKVDLHLEAWIMQTNIPECENILIFVLLIEARGQNRLQRGIIIILHHRTLMMLMRSAYFNPDCGFRASPEACVLCTFVANAHELWLRVLSNHSQLLAFKMVNFGLDNGIPYSHK